MKIEHLSQESILLLEKSDSERINFILKDNWVGYPQAKKILKDMEELLEIPKIDRMPNMLLVGETNNGKSAILKKFLDMYPPYVDEEKGTAHRPVFLIQAQPSPDESRFYGQILHEAFYPHGKLERAETKQLKVIKALSDLHVKVLVIDEFHHVLTGTANKQRIFLNVIKYLANELKISIIAAGIKEAYYVLSTDSQLMNRFKPKILPKWELNEDYYRLLATFEYRMPLKKKSNILEGNLPTKILVMSEGTIGEISNIIKLACKEAILRGEEKITHNILEKIDYISPSKRKQLIEKIR
jgi:hypothetical protein